MRRSVKVAALASAATLLAIGASMTSFAAARGWTQEDGEWVWLDSNGDRATETFKLSGTTYYWLNDEGNLGCDELVEYDSNYYYVDETGAMVRNQWREVENEDDDDEFEDTIWYYFQSSGKAYKSGKKTINGQSYIFNDEGKMMFGWIKNEGSNSYSKASVEDSESTFWKTADYYAGEANDGAVVTNAWRQIRVEYDDPETELTDVDEGENDFWFYFGSNGKKYGGDLEGREYTEADQKAGYTTKTISGHKYAFSLEDGHMLSEWTPIASNATDAQYFSDPEVGARISKGWFKVVPSKNVDSKKSEDGDNEAQWFYADNSGDLIRMQVKSINGKKYLFNDNGECKAGVYKLVFSDDTTLSDLKKLNDEDEYTSDTFKAAIVNKDASGINMTAATTDRSGVYYFETPLDTNAAMKSGSCSVEFDGETFNFKFSTSGNKGKGITKRDGNCIYVNGLKIKADKDDKYVAYKCTVVDNKIGGKVETISGLEIKGSALVALGKDQGKTLEGNYCLISSNGTIVSSGTKKDGDDYKIKVEKYLIRSVTDNDNNALLTVTPEAVTE